MVSASRPLKLVTEALLSSRSVEKVMFRLVTCFRLHTVSLRYETAGIADTVQYQQGCDAIPAG